MDALVGEAVEDRATTLDPWFLRRLMHRWFVEYNPLYLLSAALVLGGVNLISRGLAREGASSLELWLAVITELYAWALVFGAALLTRLGFHRPAVMLALLTVLYQCDLTLHTETCAYVDKVGIFASTMWLASFVGKLYVLAWAVRLRLSRAALGVPIFGALGVATLPFYLSQHDAASMTVVVAFWLFALFASALWSSRLVSSLVELTNWGHTVLQRALTATWFLWGALVLGHVLFWSSEYDLQLTILWPVGLLLTTRRLRSELATWCMVCGTLLITRVSMPSFFWAIAMMSAVTLCLRAVRRPCVEWLNAATPAADPYRTAASHVPPAMTWQLRFVRSAADARLRLFSGAIMCVYLSLWTLSWSGGSWPNHILLLDVLLTATVAVLVWKLCARAILVPLALSYVHLGVQLQLITAPSSTLHWGLLCVSVGFGLLMVSLLTSWLLRARPERGREPTPRDAAIAP
jgi:hypothetical protein